MLLGSRNSNEGCFLSRDRTSRCDGGVFAPRHIGGCEPHFVAQPHQRTQLTSNGAQAQRSIHTSGLSSLARRTTILCRPAFPKSSRFADVEGLVTGVSGFAPRRRSRTARNAPGAGEHTGSFRDGAESPVRMKPMVRTAGRWSGPLCSCVLVVAAAMSMLVWSMAVRRKRGLSGCCFFNKTIRHEPGLCWRGSMSPRLIHGRVQAGDLVLVGWVGQWWAGWNAPYQNTDDYRRYISITVRLPTQVSPETTLHERTTRLDASLPFSFIHPASVIPL